MVGSPSDFQRRASRTNRRAALPSNGGVALELRIPGTCRDDFRQACWQDESGGHRPSVLLRPSSGPLSLGPPSLSEGRSLSEPLSVVRRTRSAYRSRSMDRISFWSFLIARIARI